MPKNVLIVENDSSLSHAMRDALAAKGFAVKESNDGKGCQETMRRERPDLLVLAVDLAAGQNGYIICGKLKKDDDIKSIPVVIVGNPDGFANHKKLKTRADDYLAKPFNGDAIVDRVGALIGYPEAPPAEEALSSGDLEPVPVDDITVDPQTSEVRADPDLDMIDRVFDDGDEGPTTIGQIPMPAAAVPPPTSMPTSSPGGGGDRELRELKAKVGELKLALADANSRATEAENKARGLEQQLDARNAEFEASKSTGGKSDKEVFALREAGTKKDKEILKLKSELNSKETEIVEHAEKVNTLEQQLSELSAEAAKKDAQLKTQGARATQLEGERKKLEQQLAASKDEARAATGKLEALQSDYDSLAERAGSADRELEGLRSSNTDLQGRLSQTQSDLAEAKGEIEGLRSQHEEKVRELEEARAQLETTQIDLDSAKNQLTSQATAFAEETQQHRKKVQDLEGKLRRQEERAGRLNSRIKADEGAKSRARDALQTALDALKEGSADLDESDEISSDELAEA
jgi:DNA-binding response OmpR family regulator/predicted  nucleic acid-binding Zn-ribbon protein